MRDVARSVELVQYRLVFAFVDFLAGNSVPDFLFNGLLVDGLELVENFLVDQNFREVGGELDVGVVDDVVFGGWAELF